MNASLEAELTAVQQEVQQARAEAKAYQGKVAQLRQQVQNALLPDAKPGDKASKDMSLLLRRFQSKLSNTQAAAASWKARCKEAGAGDVEKAREAAAEQAGAAASLLASLKRRFGPDWQNGMEARNRKLRRSQGRVKELEEKVARLTAQQAISGAATSKLKAQLEQLALERQQLCEEAEQAQREAAAGPEQRVQHRTYALGFLVRPEVVAELKAAAQLRNPDGSLQLAPPQGRVLYLKLEGEGSQQRLRLRRTPQGGCTLGRHSDALYDATLGMASASSNPCELSLYKGKHWGYSCNVSVISEGRLLWKMARGAGLLSVTDADFHAAQKDVSKGDTAVPMGAKTRLIGNKQSAAGMRFDPQQEAFLHTTWGLADDMSDRRQAWGQQQLQRQQQQQQAPTQTTAAAAAAARAAAGTGVGGAHASGRAHAPAAGALVQADN